MTQILSLISLLFHMFSPLDVKKNVIEPCVFCCARLPVRIHSPGRDLLLPWQRELFFPGLKPGIWRSLFPQLPLLSQHHLHLW